MIIVIIFMMHEAADTMLTFKIKLISPQIRQLLLEI